jgi:glycosyltransferase involved in cell wall biosynthesis
MTRVLYVAPELSAHAKSAAQVRARALLPELERMVALRVIAYPIEGEERADETFLPAGRIRSVPRRRISPVELALATLTPTPRAFRRFDTEPARAAVAAALRDHRPDIVHLDSFAMLGLMKFIRSIRPECRIVAHIHDAQSARMERYTHMGSVLTRSQYWIEYRKALHFETHCIGNADLTLVDSDEDCDYLRMLSKRNSVETLPLGFNPAVFVPDGTMADLAQPAIVYSGSMKARQSVDGALFLAHEVMPLVWKERPEAHLYIVGGGPTADVLALAGNRVHVTGFVEDLAAYLRAGAVYACPLRLGSGMRTRVVEALACGTTMVATPMAVRGLKVCQSDTPWVGAESAVDFARGILSSLNGAYPHLSSQAAAYARESYSWESVATQLVAVYLEILSERE